MQYVLGACSTYWGEMYRFFGWGKPKENGKLGIFKRRWEIILKWMIKIPVESGLRLV
jgi:hypothetical protein